MCLFSRFLGHLYAAESLIKLNRVSEAMTHLSPDNVNDLNIGTGGDSGPGGMYDITDVTSCYRLLLYLITRIMLINTIQKPDVNKC